MTQARKKANVLRFFPSSRFQQKFHTTSKKYVFFSIRKTDAEISAITFFFKLKLRYSFRAETTVHNWPALRLNLYPVPFHIETISKVVAGNQTRDLFVSKEN